MISYEGITRQRHLTFVRRAGGRPTATIGSDSGRNCGMTGLPKLNDVLRTAIFDATLWKSVCNLIVHETGAEYALAVATDGTGLSWFLSDYAPMPLHDFKVRSEKSSDGAIRQREAGLLSTLRDDRREGNEPWFRTSSFDALCGTPGTHRGVSLLVETGIGDSMVFYVHLAENRKLPDQRETGWLDQQTAALSEAVIEATMCRMLALSEIAAFADNACFPMAFIDANARLLCSNNRFAKLLGSMFTLSGGTLSLAGGKISRTLRHQIEECRRIGEEQQVSVSSGQYHYILKLSVFPENRRLLLMSSTIGLTVLQLGRSSQLPSACLTSLFGLTPRETEIAGLIEAGKSVGEIAQLGGASQGTIRSQLKSIFRKVGARSQADLAAKLHI